MRSTRVPGLKTYEVAIRGPLQAAVQAAGRYEHRPLRDVEIDDDGNVHAILATAPENLERWMAESVGAVPGGLLMYVMEGAGPVS